MGGYRWDDAITDRLTELWKDGLSCSQIAARLYSEFGFEISRSAVIGKLNRMGMKSNVEVTRIKNRQANRRTMAKLGRKPRKPIQQDRERVRTGPAPGVRFHPDSVMSPHPSGACTPLPLPKEDVRPDNVVPLRDVSSRGCQWIYGDPREPDAGFCPSPAVPGTSWCAAHARRVFAAPEIKPRAPKPERIPTIHDLEKV